MKRSGTSSSTSTPKKAKSDDQRAATTLGDQLAFMVDNPACADVEFLVGVGGTPVYASKVILVARSPVFEALLSSTFLEGQPPHSPPSLPSSSSSSSSLRAPVFWHEVKLPDMEPRTMRHLLYTLYTDQLHPNFLASPPQEESNEEQDQHPTQQEYDLVALYAAADRYLVDAGRKLVKHELIRRFNDNHDYVLPVFDMAMAVAPKLAWSACRYFIEADASRLLGHRLEEMEEMWLGLSPQAAAQVLLMDLKGINEVDVFLAVERRYEHHLEEAAQGPENDDNIDGDVGKDKHTDDTRSKLDRKVEAARSKVAGLVERIKTKLLNVDELNDFVEPSGLLTDAQLCAAYKNAARTHRFVIPHVSAQTSHLSDFRLVHGEVLWGIRVTRIKSSKASMTFYRVNVVIRSLFDQKTPLDTLSASGITVWVYCNRRLRKHLTTEDNAVVTMPGEQLLARFQIDCPGHRDRLTILVHLSPYTFTCA